MTESGSTAELELAREAARDYARTQPGLLDRIAELDAAPVLGPVLVVGDGGDVTAYRWLGNGRGEDYLQVEVGANQVTVHAAVGDTGLPTRRAPRGSSADPG